MRQLWRPVSANNAVKTEENGILVLYAVETRHQATQHECTCQYALGEACRIALPKLVRVAFRLES
jgi:hypothetical protein